LEFFGARPFYRKDAVPLWKPELDQTDFDTVLLLAGDIHVGHKAKEWIEEMCERYYAVVYILGNHEFYNNEVHATRKYWNEVEIADNFYFLDDDVVRIDDTKIIGGTLWTQVTDPFMVWQGPKRMTDYQITTVREHGKVRRMNVQDTNQMHFETINFIRNELQKDWTGKTVVMTHHLPHPLCIAPHFEGDMLNAFFMTDLDHIFRNFPIDYWVHGHTHEKIDVTVHGTRILCNPMGYHGIKLNQDFNEGLTFAT